MSSPVEIPPTLPPLPHAPSVPWSAGVVEAYRGLAAGFLASRRALDLDESDPIRLGHHIKHAETFMTSIINVLGSQADNPLPPGHIREVKDSFRLLIDGLHVAHDQAKSEYISPQFYGGLLLTPYHSEASKVTKIRLIAVERSGGRGRPKKVILEAFLREAFRPGRNISIPQLASSLGVHKNTVKRYMSQYKIERQPFSTISDLSLDELIGDYKEAHPNTGIRYIRGYLTQQGMRVQRERIVDSLSRVDSVGKVTLRRKTIVRREYESSRPNALWHVDGHHKLGPWGIVIHGFVDGYDRMVCWCCALTLIMTLIPCPSPDHWHACVNTQHSTDCSQALPRHHRGVWVSISY